MKNLLARFITDESGVTMIEYGLIAALVAVVAIPALILVGGNLLTVFTFVSTTLTTAMA